MNLTRKMMRHGKRLVSPGVTSPYDRPKAFRKGVPYRRIILVDGVAVHATKGRGHDTSVLAYRANVIARGG